MAYKMATGPEVLPDQIFAALGRSPEPGQRPSVPPFGRAPGHPVALLTVPRADPGICL